MFVMLPFAYYMLKVIICSAILFGYYWFFLRNKVFHSYNRFYLLAVIVLSLCMPLIKFNIWQKTDTPKTTVIKMLEVVNSGDDYMDEVVVYIHRNTWNIEDTFWLLFIAGCVFMCGTLITTLLKIRNLKKRNPVTQFHDISLIETTDKSTPFSFFTNVFWNNAIDIQSSNGKRILKHELAHVTQRHSHDKLFLNLVLIVFWCNPIFWLLRKEINMIHEFTADLSAVEDGDSAAFAAMILQTSYPQHQFELTNNFFYSPIKRRLFMLTKNNKPKVSYFSRLLILPVACIVFAAFTLKAKTYTGFPLTEKNKQITVVIDAGHGGTDNGAVGIDGTTEKELTLSLAQKIKELNKAENINIVLTRSTDIYQTPQEKSALTKKLGGDLFVSIHVDGSPSPDQTTNSGISVWVAKDEFSNTTSSKLFASAIIGSFKKDYRLPVVDQPSQRKTGIWVLQNAPCPAVLVESGFITNKKDLAYLKSSEGQEQFAKNVLDAIYNYAAGSSITIKQSITDTIIKKKAPSDVIVSANVQMVVGEYLADKTNPLIIINNKTYQASELKYKMITAKKATFYQPNNKEMIAQYGARAKNGVMIMTDALIGNAKEDAKGYAFESDSITVKSTDYNAAGVKIRGIGKTNPLYVLDGQIIEAAKLENFPPEKISSVNVLKGKDAIQKYGDAAKDGVIEIISETQPISATTDALNWYSNNGKLLGTKVFQKVENEAEFPGGAEAWKRYLMQNLNAAAPVDEGWKSGQYTVMVKFIVNADGSIAGITTENYEGSKTAQACVDLIKKSPKWIPAKQNDIAVTSVRKQPITFVISQN